MLPLAFAIALPVWTAAKRASSVRCQPGFSLRSRITVALLHLLQPVARLCGRFAGGLHPWRYRRVTRFAFPIRRDFNLWSETFASIQERLTKWEAALRASGYTLRRGREFDRWDLEVRIGFFGGAKLWALAEEHAAGKQLIRLRIKPTCKSAGLIILFGLTVDALVSYFDGLWLPTAVIAGIALVCAVETLREVGAAVAAFLSVLRMPEKITTPDGNLPVASPVQDEEFLSTRS